MNQKSTLKVEIYINNTDTHESIYGFFENQEDESKKWIDFEFFLMITKIILWNIW